MAVKKKNNNNKVQTAERLAILETVCTHMKEVVGELKENDQKMLGVLDIIKEQVTVNKTRLALWGGLGGLIGGGIITLVIMLIVKFM